MFENDFITRLRNPLRSRICSLKYSLVLFVTLGCQVSIAAVQDTVLAVSYKGKLDSLNSEILKQKRYVQVFVPAGYKPGSTAKYDILYVLDGGNWNAGLVTQIQHFIEGSGLMPPTIIVSVMGIDRNIELTPTRLKTWGAPTGGADNFLGFIKNELIPYINKTYPSNGDNTLWGHSLSGMFVLYALSKEPALFKSYIAVDPSLWWDNCYVPRLAATTLPHLTGLKTTLFISGREGPEFHGMRIDTMELILKKVAPPSLEWKLMTYSDETHSSVRLKSIYDGLKFTYAGYSHSIEFTPMNGIVSKDKPIEIWYFDDTTRVYYTLDGKIPTEISAKAERKVTLTGAARVTFKRITNRDRYDKIVTGDFIYGEIPRPVSKLKNSKPGGLHYSYYEGEGDKWQDIKNLLPLKRGIINKDFSADSLPRKNNYALIMEGFLEIKEDGYHVFYLKAAKGSKLWLGDKLLISYDNNEEHDVYSYILPLTKGYYPMRLEYFDKKENYNCLLYYLTPGIIAGADPIPVPFEVEYSMDKK